MLPVVQKYDTDAVDAGVGMGGDLLAALKRLSLALFTDHALLGSVRRALTCVSVHVCVSMRESVRVWVFVSPSRQVDAGELERVVKVAYRVVQLGGSGVEGPALAASPRALTALQAARVIMQVWSLLCAVCCVGDGCFSFAIGQRRSCFGSVLASTCDCPRFVRLHESVRPPCIPLQIGSSKDVERRLLRDEYITEVAYTLKRCGAGYAAACGEGTEATPKAGPKRARKNKEGPQARPPVCNCVFVRVCVRVLVNACVCVYVQALSSSLQECLVQCEALLACVRLEDGVADVITSVAIACLFADTGDAPLQLAALGPLQVSNV